MKADKTRHPWVPPQREPGESCRHYVAALTEAEKASCAIAKLPGYWCTKHVSAGVKKAQSLKEEKE